MRLKCGYIQEAQLPLRNRASAMYFFVAKLLSIAIITYIYSIRLSPPRPMYDNMANLLRRERMNFTKRPQHVRMTRDPMLSLDVPFL